MVNKIKVKMQKSKLILFRVNCVNKSSGIANFAQQSISMYFYVFQVISMYFLADKTQDETVEGLL